MKCTMFRTRASIRRVFDRDTSLYPLVFKPQLQCTCSGDNLDAKYRKKIEVFKHVIHNSYRHVFLLVYMYFTF